MPRGHSNVKLELVKPWPGDEEKAQVPLIGGATVNTTRDLPALALSRDEWEAIGKAMGWGFPQVS